MRMAYEIYRPGVAVAESGEVDWPRDPGYSRIKALVGPLLNNEPLEHVGVLHEGDLRDMFVSEIGHLTLTTRGPLPINAAATIIYRRNWMSQYPLSDPDILPTIVGTAVLFTNRLVWL